MLGERIASQSELIRAIVSGYSPCYSPLPAPRGSAASRRTCASGGSPVDCGDHEDDDDDDDHHDHDMAVGNERQQCTSWKPNEQQREDGPPKNTKRTSSSTVSDFRQTCRRAGWISILLLEWLWNAVQPLGSRNHVDRNPEMLEDLSVFADHLRPGTFGFEERHRREEHLGLRWVLGQEGDVSPAVDLPLRHLKDDRQRLVGLKKYPRSPMSHQESKELTELQGVSIGKARVFLPKYRTCPARRCTASRPSAWWWCS